MIIRDGRLEDAADLARMISDFNVEEGSPGRVTRDDVVEICFGEIAIFTPIVAEEQGELVGYALIMRYFDTEPCVWSSYMQDLYVVPAKRSRGIGRRLVAASARYTLDQGRQFFFWHVREHNRRGRTFYASLGASEDSAIPVTLKGDALKTLAAEAD